MRPRRPVAHGFGHTVRLRPDDVRAQVPPIRLQRKRDAPRNADQVFGFEYMMGRCGIIYV